MTEEKPLSRALIAEQLESLSDRLEIACTDDARNDPAAIAAWQDRLTITPQEIVDTLLCNISSPAKIWIDFPPKRASEFAIYLCTLDDDAPAAAREKHASYNDIPGRKMRMIRTFDTEKKTVSGHGVRIFNPDNRDHGMARQPIENFLNLSATAGMKEMSIHAGEIGAYAWTKYGFLPKQADWEELREKIALRFRLLQEHPVHGEKIPVAVADKVESLLTSQDPRSIWHIADMAAPSSGLALGKRLLLPGFEKFVPAYADIVPPDARDLHWSGVLRFDNPEQSARLKNYLATGKTAPVDSVAPERPVQRQEKSATL